MTKHSDSRRFSAARLALAMAAAVTATCLTACKHFETGRDAIYVVELYPVGQPLVSPNMTGYVSDYEGSKTVPIHRMAILTSKDIVRGEYLPPERPGDDPGVRLNLTPAGSMRWMSVCRNTPGDVVVLVVDGFYRFHSRIPHRREDTTELVLRGRWDATEAEAVASHAERNYELFNP